MASITVNDVYLQFQNLIRSDNTLGLPRKQEAFNQGYLYLLEKMITVAGGIDELLVVGLDLPALINTNYVELPEDFFKIFAAWKNVGNQFNKFFDSQNIDFDQLMDLCANTFYTTTNYGTPTWFSVKKPLIYFDNYFAASSSNPIKISYWKMPNPVVFYDQINIEDVTGTFEVGEIITGSESTTTATVYQVDDDFLYLVSSPASASFAISEIITGGTSGATATVTASVLPKVEVLELGSEYLQLLAMAVAINYYAMRGLYEEAQALDQTFSNLVYMRNKTNNNKKFQEIGMARRWR